MPYDELMIPLTGLVAGVLFFPVLLGLARVFGLYAVVQEREAQEFTLFGKVLGTLDQPGLSVPIAHFGLKSLLVPFFGKRHQVSSALRQYYLRDQMVNSEEGTPMGVGIWYEMQVSDPVDYLFKNANPEGSLQANVASSTISTLSNLEMDKMLEDRHQLSHKVRDTVSPLSEKWGYKLGSVYIRKVAFTNSQMVDNITEKVVKRLVQVTSAMKQDGENRVGLIQSQTAYKVSQKMAE
ncbi:MAG: SPFH domain-containing protein, partial [Chromatiaceae bacterium]